MHSFPPAYCVRAKPNTEPSQSSASNPIGTEKRHSVRVSCGDRELVEGAEQVKGRQAGQLVTLGVHPWDIRQLGDICFFSQEGEPAGQPAVEAALDPGRGEPPSRS